MNDVYTMADSLVHVIITYTDVTNNINLLYYYLTNAYEYSYTVTNAYTTINKHCVVCQCEVSNIQLLHHTVKIYLNVLVLY